MKKLPRSLFYKMFAPIEETKSARLRKEARVVRRDRATIFKETRQLRRARERAEAKAKEVA